MPDSSIQQDKELRKHRVIIVNFVGGKMLKLTGEHVPPFLENYTKAVNSNARYFMSAGNVKILINIQHVTFIEDFEEELSS
jgi:hypothetical protein